MGKFNNPKITRIIPNISKNNNYNFVEAFYYRLVSTIIDFEKNIKSNEEVGARLVSFGETIVINITT